MRTVQANAGIRSKGKISLQIKSQAICTLNLKKLAYEEEYKK